MRAYIGTKVVMAEPMSDVIFEDRFKRLPSSPTELLVGHRVVREGYVVTYEDGYTSWSPKHTFEKAYREVSFSEQGMLFHTDGNNAKTAMAGAVGPRSEQAQIDTRKR